MGVSINDVIENGLLSPEVIDCIPHVCTTLNHEQLEENIDAEAQGMPKPHRDYGCGTPLELTDSLYQIYCPNRFCTLKIAARLEAMAKAMKVDGWGESTCREVCRNFKLKSPYQVFLLEQEVANGRDCPSVSAFEKKVAAICDRSKRRVKLWEVVRFANIPSIETIAYKIFDGYDNLEEAYAEIEALQVPFIAEKLGLRNTDTGVMAVNIYNTLITFKQELLFGETQFDVYKPTGETFYIAITGGVQGFTNKSEYVQFLNSRYQGKLNAMLMNSVTHQVHVLVADGDTSSNKYKTACRLRDKGSEIIITDSRGLIAMLDKRFMNS